MNLEFARRFDLNSIDRHFIDNPHSTLHALRSYDPVHYNADGSVFLTRYDHVRQVYQDRTMSSDKTRDFGRKFGPGPLLTHHTTSLVFNDPPYHTVVRKLLATAFTPRKLAELEPLIESIVDQLLDRLEDLGEFDFITEFAMKLPTELISYMLGVPEEHRQRLRGYSLAILGALDPVVSKDRLQAGNSAVKEFSALLDELIAHRRRNPGKGGQGEVLEALIFGNVDGRSLTDEELRQNCIFLLNAGHETTTNLIGNGVELLLRFESSNQLGNRTTTVDVNIGGVRIPAGTVLTLCIGAANCDPDVFDNPDAFDVTRTRIRILHSALASILAPA